MKKKELYGIEKERQIKAELSRAIDIFLFELYMEIYGVNPYRQIAETDCDDTHFTLAEHKLIETYFSAEYDYTNEIRAVEQYAIVGYGFDATSAYVIDNTSDWLQLSEFTIDELIKIVNNIESNLNLYRERKGK